MCNAHNHPFGCDCGWGGATRTKSFSSATPISTNSPIAFSSYVKPNAICPVCGAPVFFYQSPFGGRVYFDEMGPPWPKHPCTSNDRAIPLTTVGIKIPFKKPAWDRDGWCPFENLWITSISPSLLEFSGDLLSEPTTLYVPRLAYEESTAMNASKFTLACYLKNLGYGLFSIAILDPANKGRNLYGYSSRLDAENGNDRLKNEKTSKRRRIKITIVKRNDRTN